jgi:transcriptional repressor NrdR
VELSNLVVIKKDGKREPFSREKLQKGIYIACQKRPISTDEIQALINKIEMELRRKDETEIKGNVIGNYVMKALKKLDKIAYIRFASVYRDFADIEEFQKELTKLNKTDKKTNKGETGRK